MRVRGKVMGRVMIEVSMRVEEREVRVTRSRGIMRDDWEGWKRKEGEVRVTGLVGVGVWRCERGREVRLIRSRGMREGGE